MLASCVPGKVTCLAVLKLSSGRLAVPQLGLPTDFPFFKIHRISAGGNDLNRHVLWPVSFGPLGNLQWLPVMTQAWQGRRHHVCTPQLWLLTPWPTTHMPLHNRWASPGGPGACQHCYKRPRGPGFPASQPGLDPALLDFPTEHPSRTFQTEFLNPWDWRERLGGQCSPTLTGPVSAASITGLYNTTQTNPFTEQKQAHRHREQTSDYQRGRWLGEGKIGSLEPADAN